MRGAFSLKIGYYGLTAQFGEGENGRWNWECGRWNDKAESRAHGA